MALEDGNLGFCVGLFCRFQQYGLVVILPGLNSDGLWASGVREAILRERWTPVRSMPS